MQSSLQFQVGFIHCDHHHIRVFDIFSEYCKKLAVHHLHVADCGPSAFARSTVYEIHL